MRILLIGPAMGLPIPPDGWGGIEKVIWKTSQELICRGHVVDIFNTRDFNELHRILTGIKYDVVHVHLEWPVDFLIHIGIPYVFTSHLGTWKDAWHTIDGSFRKCKMAMPFYAMSDKVENKNKWPIQNGADNKLFHPAVKIQGSCLAVGRYEARKKFDEIAATANGDLTIIGPGHEGVVYPPNVKTIGNLPEEKIAEIMGESETFYHLAEHEADCLVVKEAAMSGCKLVLSDYCHEVFWRGQEECNPFDFSIQNYTWAKVVDNIEKGYLYYSENFS